MRRLVLVGSFAVLLVVVLVGCIVLSNQAVKSPPNNTNAQLDLRIALTSAVSYARDNHGSLVGFTGSTGVPSVHPGGGVVWTSGDSTSAQLVGLHIARDGTYLVLASMRPNPPACFGILYVMARQHQSVLGETAAGTYFFVARTTACKASTVVPRAISTTGFPSG
ncbi:MAG: hypothetical protein ABSE47_13770 [Acidimicrobiales bacterium]|jgi:hypothetical protein